MRHSHDEIDRAAGRERSQEAFHNSTQDTPASRFTPVPKQDMPKSVVAAVAAMEHAIQFCIIAIHEAVDIPGYDANNHVLIQELRQAIAGLKGDRP